jgi:hypothetical protein
VICLIAALGSFSLHAQSSGGASGTSGTGSAGNTTTSSQTGSDTRVDTGVSGGSTTPGVGTSGTDPRTGRSPLGTTDTGISGGSLTPGVGVGTGGTPGLRGTITNSIVGGAPPLNPNLQTGPAFQSPPRVPFGTNLIVPGRDLGAFTNQFGVITNRFGAITNRLRPFTNQFGVVTNRFGTNTNLLPTSRTNSFDRILQDGQGNNRPGRPVGGDGATPPPPLSGSTP